MTRLNLSKNRLLSKEGGRALGNMLKANTTLKELDVSDSGDGMVKSEGDTIDKDGPGFATAISEGLAGNGELSVLSLKKNGLGTKEAGKALGEMLKVNSVLKELDLCDNAVASWNGGDALGFAQELALGIKDNGALQCTDGTPYQSEKSFMMSTYVCRHCGQHKTQHTSR
jgi:Ran GTPase-activating protein (RanGAP) involved in mRNA processing and transport